MLHVVHPDPLVLTQILGPRCTVQCFATHMDSHAETKNKIRWIGEPGASVYFALASRELLDLVPSENKCSQI